MSETDAKIITSGIASLMWLTNQIKKPLLARHWALLYWTSTYLAFHHLILLNLHQLILPQVRLAFFLQFLLPYKCIQQMFISKWIVGICVSLFTHSNTYTLNSIQMAQTLGLPQP